MPLRLSLIVLFLSAYIMIICLQLYHKKFINNNKYDMKRLSERQYLTSIPSNSAHVSDLTALL